MDFWNFDATYMEASPKIHDFPCWCRKYVSTRVMVSTMMLSVLLEWTNMYCYGKSRCYHFISIVTFCAYMDEYHLVRSIDRTLLSTMWCYYDRWFEETPHIDVMLLLWICTCFAILHSELYNYNLSYDITWLIYVFVVWYLWRCYDAYLFFYIYVIHHFLYIISVTYHSFREKSWLTSLQHTQE